MTNKQRDRQVAHWQKVIKDLEKKCEKSIRICGCLNSDDRQQIAYAEYRIEQIREEWRLAAIEALNQSKK